MYCFSKTKLISCCDDECCALVKTATTSTPVSRLCRSWFVHSLCLSRISLRYTAADRSARRFHPHPSTKYPQLMQSISTACFRAESRGSCPTQKRAWPIETDTPVV